ncbi:related to tRNA modification GTPase MSS1, mitochondrial [Saccharomycodes ludwigii]|uniref:Related to tRNA modification GTPase MSS1, mitochondrial n=1 Tax=Saccharomycodes ludwigii TaxID=36035 RepID=A0A376B2I9_9ASCO|nr:hypothetical protein SCDLUD_004178 [Saccharomycodes ludwigii]KAH3899878.1 hypothetical protein SCDLUD_004178 [Saccharomycodes ludwigii]SSD58350.1 related to tRNA modification GTPase MSS1, mitochondrial [Saccharomycodes ludwigii]
MHRSLTSYLPTIYALSTPPGQRSAIAVIRISGAKAKYIYHKLTKSKAAPIPRRASLRKIYEPQKNGKLLDQALVLFFEEPKTFTGEDILEVHLHGGKAVTNGVLKSIQSLHSNSSEENISIRYAQPGEFSKRAFQNGRADLTQLEGIGDLIDAETESQRKSALSSFNGENKVLFSSWRKSILENMAQLTAIIDFGEDADIEDIDNIFNGVSRNVELLKGDISSFVKKLEKSNILKAGIKLALIGEPNAGKSSLLNTMVDDNVAIVSNIPGTTRDSIDVMLDLEGYKVVICDTAGIRNKSSDEIELQGIERAKLKSVHSDIVLLLVDSANPSGNFISEDMLEHFNTSLKRKEVFIVLTKTDLLKDRNQLAGIKESISKKLNGNYPICAISCVENTGVEELMGSLISKFQEITNSNDETGPIIVSKRVEEILHNDVLYGLKEFQNAKALDDVVMASEGLNIASEGIGKITGETIGVEEVLGVVFSNFCVGK